MTADAVLRLVRVMQANPQLGILQGLVVGMPSTSAFARIFQFGMRLGMRSYTIGGAWWQGDCGPYWGHNAAVRLAPFIAHCHIAPLAHGGPLGGHVLSHDQVEAVLMRRAGYEVRVLPEEDLGWEENPPTLIEFIRRDLRWCQGTLQYWYFLFQPRHPARQPLPARLRGADVPGLARLDGTAGRRHDRGRARRDAGASSSAPTAGMALFLVVLIMWFAPKIATIIDVLTRPKLRSAFGGGFRFVGNVATETVFFLMLSPIMWFGHTVFLTGLLFGRTIGWIGQTRDDHAVPWSAAARQLWPQTLLGPGVDRAARRHASFGDSVCAVHRGRPGAVDPARGASPRCRASAAPSRASASAACRRRPRRRRPLRALALPAIADATQRKT